MAPAVYCYCMPCTCRLCELYERKACGQPPGSGCSAAALRWLRAKWSINRLLCEGGGELNDTLFRAGLVDEIHLTICPEIFGGRCAPTIADGSGMKRLADAKAYQIQSIKQVEGELFTVFSRKK